MTSTQYSIGMSNDRSSSRVLKPPGGGHTNIFTTDSQVHVPSPRPKYDQQNSSNLNFCMNTVDPNIKVEQKKQDVVKPEPATKPAADADPKPSAPASAPAPAPAPTSAPPSSARSNGSNGFAAAPAPPLQSAQTNDGGQSRGNRVPPGGFSSGGFW